MAIGGRPTKYKPEFTEIAIDYIGNSGKSVTQLARHLKVAKSTVYKWAEDHQEFSDALTLARDWSEAFWEDKLTEMMSDRDINAPLVKLYLANRFKWTDKPQQEDSETKPITINLVDAKKPDEH